MAGTPAKMKLSPSFQIQKYIGMELIMSGIPAEKMNCKIKLLGYQFPLLDGKNVEDEHALKYHALKHLRIKIKISHWKSPYTSPDLTVLS